MRQLPEWEVVAAEVCPVPLVSVALTGRRQRYECTQSQITKTCLEPAAVGVVQA